MRRYSYLIALFFSVTFIAGSSSPVLAVSDDSQFSQYIAPLECVVDIVSNGVDVKTILSPQDCYDYLHPFVPPTGDQNMSPTFRGYNVQFPFVPTTIDGDKQLTVSRPSYQDLQPIDYAEQQCPENFFSMCKPFWSFVAIMAILAGLILLVSVVRRRRGE